MHEHAQDDTGKSHKSTPWGRIVIASARASLLLPYRTEMVTARSDAGGRGQRKSPWFHVAALIKPSRCHHRPRPAGQAQVSI